VVSPGVAELDILALMGLNVYFQAVMLSEELIAVVGSETWEQEGLVAVIHNLATGGNVTVALPGNGISATFARDGNLVFTYHPSIGGERIAHEFTVTPEGETRSDAVPPRGERRFPLADGVTHILEHNAGLWLLDETSGEKTLLLEGKHVDVYDTACEHFYFFEAIDETRFVYGIRGWEFGLGVGIFDVSTMTDHRIDPIAFGGSRGPHRIIGDRLFTVDHDMGPFFDGAITDLNTYETRRLSEAILSYHEQNMGWIWSWAFSPDGTRVAFLRVEMDTDDFRYDTVTMVFLVECGTQIAEFFVACSGASVQYVSFITNDRLLLSGGSVYLRNPYVFFADIPPR
jgi:hypothetical protein